MKTHEVVPWNVYYPSLSSATKGQRTFYKWWAKEFEQGHVIDVEGNLSYIFVYLYGVLSNYSENRDLEAVVSTFNKIEAAFGHYKKILDYLNIWLSDIYSTVGDYDRAWELKRKGFVRVHDVLLFKQLTTDDHLDAYDLWALVRTEKKLNQFAQAHMVELCNRATAMLESLHKLHGCNLVKYMCKERFSCWNLSEKDLTDLRTYYKNQEQYNRCVDLYRNEPKRDGTITYDHRLFPGTVGNIEKSTIKAESVPPIIEVALMFPGAVGNIEKSTIKAEFVPAIIEVALINEAKRILSDVEKELRQKYKDKPRTRISYSENIKLGPKCPSCGHQFYNFPSSQSRCPNCRSPLIVRSKDSVKFLFTAETVKAFDSERKEMYLKNRLVRNYLTYFMNEKLFRFSTLEQEKVRIEAAIGQPLTWEQVTWRILEEFLDCVKVATPNDFNLLKMIYFHMARFQEDHDGDFFDAVRNTIRMEILSFTRGSIKFVRISSDCKCKSCSDLNGKMFSIVQALKEMPMPNENCSDKKRGFRKCSYVPVFSHELQV